MRLKSNRMEKVYLLDRAGVDAISSELERWLKRTGVNRKSRIRIRLTMEEVLLRICEHFDEKMNGTLIIRRRFGTPVLRLRYQGECFNPLQLPKEETDEAIRQVLARIGLAPEWSYRAGVNELTLHGPGKTLRSEIRLLGAVFLAALCGFLPALLPEAVKTGLLDYLLVPVSDAFMNALNTFVGMMIFLSVVSGICSIGSMADFSRMGRYSIGCMIRQTLIGTAVSAVLLRPFFHFGTGSVESGQSQMGELVDLVFSIIPSNPVTPFAEGNMLQIIFMAVLIGTGLLVLGKRIEKLKDLVIQLDVLLMQVISAVCKLLPLYIFTSLTSLLWENGAGIFVRLWRPIVLLVGVCAILLAAKAAITGARLKVSLGMLFSKIRGNMLTGLATASSSAAFGQMVDVNEKGLGIEPVFNHFSLPFANLLMGSSVGAALVAMVYYLADYYAVPVNLGWFISMWLMCSLFSMAMPPVSGGMLVCVGILMAQLNIPAGGLAVAGILGIVLDFISTGAKVGLSHMELLLQAAHLDLLDRDILQRRKT